jgi:hypothetical protein
MGSSNAVVFSILHLFLTRERIRVSRGRVVETRGDDFNRTDVAAVLD